MGSSKAGDNIYLVALFQIKFSQGEPGLGGVSNLPTSGNVSPVRAHANRWAYYGTV